MKHHALYLSILDDLVESSGRADLPNVEVRRRALMEYLDRDSEDGRQTIEVPREDHAEEEDVTFHSLSLDEDAFENLNS